MGAVSFGAKIKSKNEDQKSSFGVYWKWIYLCFYFVGVFWGVTGGDEAQIPALPFTSLKSLTSTSSCSETDIPIFLFLSPKRDDSPDPTTGWYVGQSFQAGSRKAQQTGRGDEETAG